MAQIEESVARYLQQLDTADRQEPTEALGPRRARLKEKIAKLKEEMAALEALKEQMLATPDQQISLTDPDARSMATSGRGSGVVGYNVQVAVDTETSSDRRARGDQRRERPGAARAHGQGGQGRRCGAEKLEAVADRGYFNGEEILACEEAASRSPCPSR